MYVYMYVCIYYSRHGMCVYISMYLLVPNATVILTIVTHGMCMYIYTSSPNLSRGSMCIMTIVTPWAWQRQSIPAKPAARHRHPLAAYRALLEAIQRLWREWGQRAGPVR